MRESIYENLKKKFFFVDRVKPDFLPDPTEWFEQLSPIQSGLIVKMVFR